MAKILYSLSGIDEDGNAVVDIDIPETHVSKILLDLIATGVARVTIAPDLDGHVEVSFRKKTTHKKNRVSSDIRIGEDGKPEEITPSGRVRKSKLSTEDREDILSALKEEKPVKQIAENYGVSDALIYTLKAAFKQEGRL